jgi:putative glutamine amidotransferase
MAVLGITDTLRPNFEHYETWIKRLVPTIAVVKLSHMVQNAEELGRCDGLVLTGGGDVHPQYYGREDMMSVMKGVNISRDEFEFTIIDTALRRGLPILGICRGMQVFNVAAGGTLMPDVQSAGYQNHRTEEGNVDGLHTVRVIRGTMIEAIIGKETGEVNTHHHQAVDRVGKDLQPVVYSDDGLVEALEWKQKNGRPFLLLVQWHPERMTTFESPFSKGILEYFVNTLKRSFAQRINY